MKKAIILWATAALTTIFLFAQEAPPAFEKAGDPDPFADPVTIQPSDDHDHFDPARIAPKIIRIQVEFIEIPHKVLTKLMMTDKSKSSDATVLRKKVQEIINKDDGEILETMMVYSRSGERSTTESIHEFIYPTEYDPTSFKEEENTVQAFPSNPGMPTAFETRNVGSTLEVEPCIGEDDTTIDLRIIPEMIWHTGNTIWQETKDKNGNIFKSSMPDFYTLRTASTITCISGQYHLASFLTPKSDSGKANHNSKIMLFVKCDVQPVMK